MSERPAVSVIVAFAGADGQRAELLARLAALALGADDEVLVVDNRRDAGAVPVDGAVDGGVRVLPAAGTAAAGFARNRGARLARGDWLVFIDADVHPFPGLLKAYFDPPPGPDAAVLAGAIRDRPGGDGLAARTSARRGQMSQRVTLDRAGTPYAQTANCAVRRAAFETVGGFDEQARCGEDADLCFRLAALGWRMEERPAAIVEHITRRTLPALLVQLARHGSGAAWLHRRYPGEFAPPSARSLCRRVGGQGRRAAVSFARGAGDEGGEALIELLSGMAFEAGRLLPNRPGRT